MNMRNIIALFYSTEITDCGKRVGGTITIKITSDIVFRVQQSVEKKANSKNGKQVGHMSGSHELLLVFCVLMICREIIFI